MNARSCGTAAWTAILKTMLLIFNLVFFAFGVAFCIVGIYGMTVFKNFFTFAPSKTIFLPFIGIGTFMIVIGLLSIWYTSKGVTWCLNIYGIIVFVLFVAVLAMSSLFVVRRDTFEQTLQVSINDAIHDYPKDKDSIDLLQKTLHCCGSKNYTDWFSTKWADSKLKVPESCCKQAQNCAHENLKNNTTDIYIDGCYNRVYNTIENNYAIIGGIGFASAVIILFGSLLSCSLARNLKKTAYEQVE